MKALVIKPKDDNDYKFLTNLLNKLGVGASSISEEQLEDIGLSKILKKVDKSNKASRSKDLSNLKVKFLKQDY